MSLVFVNTRYQLQVFLDIASDEGIVDFILLAPMEIAPDFVRFNIPMDRSIFLDGLNGRMGFFESRKLLKSFKNKLLFLRSRPVVFFLANDDHILAQFVVRYINIKEIYLFEDGLGSYVKHRPMMLDMGMKGFLSKLKKIVFFAPYYRSIFRFGGNFKATKCYSYREGCFPSQREVERVLINRRANSSRSKIDIPIGAVFFVGQPLVEAGFISKNDYKELLLEVRERFFIENTIYYKPHPRESDFSKVPQDYFVVTRSDVTLESEIESLNSEIILVGFYSTVLANCKNSDKVLNVMSIKSSRIRVPDRYYEALEVVQCQIVKV